MFGLGIERQLVPKDVHGFFNFQLEDCRNRVKDVKSVF